MTAILAQFLAGEAATLATFGVVVLHAGYNLHKLRSVEQRLRDIETYCRSVNMRKGG